MIEYYICFDEHSFSEEADDAEIAKYFWQLLTS